MNMLSSLKMHTNNKLNFREINFLLFKKSLSNTNIIS
jgi:hypothetical protein